MKRLTIAILMILMIIASLAPSPARAQTGCGAPPPGWHVHDEIDVLVPTNVWSAPTGAEIITVSGAFRACGYIINGDAYAKYARANDSSAWSWANNAGIPYWSAEHSNGEIWVWGTHVTAATVMRVLIARTTPPSSPTPTPPPTPTPTNTPTPTPTPTPDLVQTQVSIGQTSVAGGTPPASWCGYVPTHPCWVAYATQSALEQLMATVAARASSNAPQAVEVINFPTPVPTATPEMAEFRQTATAALAAAPVSYTGGTVEYDSGQLGAGAPQFWSVRLYDFGCPIDVSDPWQIRICIRYHHIEQLRILPEPLPAIDPVIFIGALALLVVRWFIQR